MQAALFNPSPFEREWQELDKEQRDLLKAMDAKLAALKLGAGAVVAANR